jgi:sulfur-oxidizing protein SoxZ
MSKNVSHKIRARLKDGAAEVKLLIRHPMETGRRKDPVTGLKVPRHYIREIHCEHNDEEVLSGDWSWGMARNPYLSFRIPGAGAGDRIRVYWTDDKGTTEAMETLVV